MLVEMLQRCDRGCGRLVAAEFPNEADRDVNLPIAKPRALSLATTWLATVPSRRRSDLEGRLLVLR
jgi:hypothetical protein